MNKKQTGQLIAVAYLLHTAAEVLASPSVGTWKLRRQAERVMRGCTRAIGAVGGLVLINRNGTREVPDAMKRQAKRAVETFERVAMANLERRQMYCSEYTASRVMACHYAIDDMARKHGAPKEWRRLEQVTATMLGMLLHDLGQEEARMFAVAENFLMEVAA